MMWFLIVYHRKRQELETFRAYSNAEYDAAWEARGQLSREFVRDPNIEVVLLGSDSEATIRVTHARYFQPPMAVTDGR